MSAITLAANLIERLDVGIREEFIEYQNESPMLTSRVVVIHILDQEFLTFDFGKYLSMQEVYKRLKSFLEGANEADFSPLMGIDKLAGLVFLKRDWPGIKAGLENANGVF